FLYTLNLSADGRPAGEPKRSGTRDFQPRGLAWKADGESLIMAATFGSRGLLWTMDFRSGEARLLPLETRAAAYPSISYSAARLVYSSLDSDTNLWRADAEGTGFGKPRVFIHSTGADTDVHYCPDGKRIVFASTRTGEWAIWRAERDGSN